MLVEAALAVSKSAAVRAAVDAARGLFDRKSRVDVLRNAERKHGFYSKEYQELAKKYPKAAAKRATRAEKRILAGRPNPRDLARLEAMARRTPGASAYPPVIAGPRVVTAGRLTIPQWARLATRRVLSKFGAVGVGITAWEIGSGVIRVLARREKAILETARRVAKSPRARKAAAAGVIASGVPGMSPFPTPPVSATRPPPPPSPRLLPRARGTAVPTALPGGAALPTKASAPAPSAPAPSAPAPTAKTRREKIEQILADIGTAIGTYQLIKSVMPSGGGSPRRRQYTPPVSDFQPAAAPIGLTAYRTEGVTSGPCKCGPKKPRKKRPPRSVCYRGTYVETPTGLRKRRGKRVSCQPSRKKRQ